LARDVKEAADLLIDCVATFSCAELCPYPEFVVYTIISNILHLPRTELKEKIIDGPDILSVAPKIPVVVRTWCSSYSLFSHVVCVVHLLPITHLLQIKLVNALYDCDYKAYLHAMVEVQPILLADRFLQPHAGYIMRELHVLGYKQFLDSYKSVTLESMAASFGVSVEYLDLQLSRFIAAGRLTAKIDKFGGVVETNRADLKNAQYREMIQKGDHLLNRIQKLSRVVDL
jgi:26S proteasome regulatory subunit N7